MSQASPASSKPRLLGLAAALGLIAALCLLLIPGATGSAKGQSEPTATAAKAKKKKKQARIMTQNLYLGSDLNKAIAAADAVRVKDFLPADRLTHYQSELFAIREDVLELIKELRSQGEQK